MKISPIILFVYNRPTQTKEVLNTLSQCQLATISELYIFSDAAKTKDTLKNVDAVRRIIDDPVWTKNFKCVHIIKSKENKGLAESIISGVTKIIDQYGSTIVLEDDNRVAPDFLDYMNRGLEFYSDIKSIGMIGGYTAPIKFPTYYNKDVFLMGRGSSYAWGTWKDRWELVDWDVNDYDEFKKDKEAKKRFAAYGDDKLYMLEKQVNGGMDSWAIRFSYAMFKNNWQAILPVQTRIENIGFDGTGVHNGAGEKTFNVTIEPNLSPVKFENLEINQDILKEYVQLFNVSSLLKLKRYIKSIKDRIWRR